MSFKYPWDEGTADVATRLVENEDGSYGFEFHGGDNKAADRYRHQVRTSDERGFTPSHDMRLVAHLLPGEILKLYEETGIMAGADKPEAVVWALNQSDYKLFRTIEDKIGRAVKD